jgi:hypothetical protein
VGSKTFDGVRFAAWSDDHDPPHVHGYYAGVQVILDLVAENEEIVLANRKRRVIPSNAKKSYIDRIVRVANKNADAVFKLWEEARSWESGK